MIVHTNSYKILESLVKRKFVGEEWDIYLVLLSSWKDAGIDVEDFFDKIIETSEFSNQVINLAEGLSNQNYADSEKTSDFGTKFVVVKKSLDVSNLKIPKGCRFENLSNGSSAKRSLKSSVEIDYQFDCSDYVFENLDKIKGSDGELVVRFENKDTKRINEHFKDKSTEDLLNFMYSKVHNAVVKSLAVERGKECLEYLIKNKDNLSKKNSSKGYLPVGEVKPIGEYSPIGYFKVITESNIYISQKDIEELYKLLPEKDKKEASKIHDFLNIEPVEKDALLNALMSDADTVEFMLNMNTLKELSVPPNVLMQLDFKTGVISENVLEYFGYKLEREKEIKGRLLVEAVKMNKSLPDLTKKEFIVSFIDAATYLLNSDLRFNNNKEILDRALKSWLDEKAMKSDLEKNNANSKKEAKTLKF